VLAKARNFEIDQNMTRLSLKSNLPVMLKFWTFLAWQLFWLHFEKLAIFIKSSGHPGAT
jgi:hypothetical protein